MDTALLISRLEEELQRIESIYLKYPDEYFFTEKELHSYFYHLCLAAETFILNNKFNLIHAEYPTPFKCSVKKDPPYFEIEDIKSNFRRSHIDLVLFNPNFIEWIRKFENPYDYVRGLRNELFSNYIQKFIHKYEQFYEDNRESVLLYALEFKYFRASYEGIKHPIISVRQDVEKLKSTKSFKLKFMKNELPFSDKILSLVFIGEKNKNIIHDISVYYKDNKDTIRLIAK
jgi:hypothetical protein